MSIRAKITLWVLAIGLSEAFLLGLIGYHSVAAVARDARELRRIGDAIEGVRVLNVALMGLSDPSDLFVAVGEDAAQRFTGRLDGLERQAHTCAATSCHGYAKRPPSMAEDIIRDLGAIRQSGLHVLTARAADGQPDLSDWLAGVDAPTRGLSRATTEMSDTLMERAKEIERSSRDAERSAVFLVLSATLLCVFAAAALCHPLARSITRPLDALSEQTRRIADGDLSARADEDSGSLDSAELARSFNRMAERIDRSRAGLLEHQAQLEGLVRDRVHELRAKDMDLKRSERMASIGLVAGTVAHDLNNPLTNILLNAEALTERIAPDAPERRIVDDIAQSASRCRAIALDIRSLGREAELDCTPCDTAGLVDEAVRLLRFRWEPREIKIERQGAEAGRPCLCSAPHLIQVLMNLIDNAIQCTSDGGGVTVRIGGERETVIEVIDRGPGIPARDRAALFRPFFTTKPQGTGLGLAVSKRIVERHGGRIEIETRSVDDDATAPTGTTVRIAIPGPGLPS